jgi:hypothetical protein
MKTITLLFATLAILIQDSAHPAAFKADPGATLQGVSEIEVVVEGLPLALTNLGVSESQIKSDAELRMRTARLPIRDSARSFLYLNINGIALADGLIAYNVSVKLKQPAMLLWNAKMWADRSGDGKSLAIQWDEVGKPSGGKFSADDVMEMAFSLDVTTYEKATLGTVPASRQPESVVRKVCSDLVDQFSNDYLSAREGWAELLRQNEAAKRHRDGTADKK